MEMGGGDMDHGMGMMTNGTHMMKMHMTFFWGKDVQILFSGWPGSRGVGMYLLSLLFVFSLSLLVECLSAASRRLALQSTTATAAVPVSAGLLLTSLHAVHVALGYMVMLAVMSFNIGVLIVAVAGHALGFLVSGSGVLTWSRPDPAHQLNGNDLPCTKC